MNKRQVTLIAVILISALIIFLIMVFLQVQNIAQGSQPGTIPNGYELVEANGYQFSTHIRGEPDSTPVLLLHGFPESSAMWRRLTVDLNNAGYYTIAPDQRGYSAGARPNEIDQYQLKILASDVMAIANELGLDTFHLIGHDWGSGVGWMVAAQHPGRLKSYISLSVPHITAFGRAYREDSLQYEASDYIRNFQRKLLPEYMLAKDQYQILKSIWSSHPEPEVGAYLDLFQQKGALTGAINWYRANYPLFREGIEIGTITVPTVFIWGSGDSALKRSGVEMTESYVEGYYRFVEVDAGHWLIQEAYDEVYTEILTHLEKFN